jgi:glyoxylase-like metal-dependent hydrolase (beta-lactamase superfamily II)
VKIAKGVEILEITATLATGAELIHPTLIWDEGTVILVDAGSPGQLPQFQAAMAQAGAPFERLSKIIITHHDMDHPGGLAGMLNSAPQKIAVLAHEAEKPYIQAEVPPLRLAQIEAQINFLPEERRPYL